MGKGLTREEIEKVHMELLEKKQKDDHLKEKKRHAYRRHLDYSTRAIRETEIPRIMEHYEKQREEVSAFKFKFNFKFK